MLCRILTVALIFGSLAFADVSSSSEETSSGYLDLPDTLSDELQQVAQEGFFHGFALASAVMVATGALSVGLHLINRGAGR